MPPGSPSWLKRKLSQAFRKDNSTGFPPNQVPTWSPVDVELQNLLPPHTERQGKAAAQHPLQRPRSDFNTARPPARALPPSQFWQPPPTDSFWTPVRPDSKDPPFCAELQFPNIVIFQEALLQVVRFQSLLGYPTPTSSMRQMLHRFPSTVKPRDLAATSPKSISTNVHHTTHPMDIGYPMC